MALLETLKKTFLLKEPKYKEVSDIDTDKIDYELQTQEPENIAIGFRDEGNQEQDFFLNRSHKKWAGLVKQKIKIQSYREAAKMPEVQDGIDDIINEAGFSERHEPIVKLDINEANNKIKDAMLEEFNNVYRNVINLEENIYQLMEKFYIDGQLNLRLSYEKNKVQEAVKRIEVISPFYFYYDKDTTFWQYLDVKTDRRGMITNIQHTDEKYTREEIIRIDSGIYNVEENIILGWLDNSIKSINQLQTLEDLLIPMRFSRSVSRRVFNVDVGDLTPGKAETYLQKVKNEFKYKKVYDTETGTIKNNQHIASMVEDYWFANRNGARGTVVDVLDETGNLGELEDLKYFQEKIFRSMRVPSSRALRGDGTDMYSPNNEEISQQEMKFYLFVIRFRQRFMPLIKNIFKRNVLAKGIMTAEEYTEFSEKMEFYFTGENKFFLKMKQMQIQNEQDIYTSMKEDMGSANGGIYSYQFMFQNVFGMTEEETKERLKEIDKERHSKEFKLLYTVPDDGL